MSVAAILLALPHGSVIRAHNWARTASVSADAVFSAFSVASITDGDRSTKGDWDGGNSMYRPASVPFTVIFDLGSAKSVEKISVWPLMEDVNYTRVPTVVDLCSSFGLEDYTIESSPDNSTWTTQVTVTGNTLARREDVITPVSARYWKIHCTAVYGSVGGLVELELWDTDVTDNIPVVFIGEGDSLTAGGGASPSAWTTSFSTLTSPLGTKVYNVATAGERMIGQIDGEYTTDIIPKLDTHSWRRNILCLLAGTNDFADTAATAADVYDSIVDYVANVRAAAAAVPANIEIWVFTIPARGDSGAAVAMPKIATFNTMLISDHSFCDRIVRLDQIPEVNDPNDTTYYQTDKLHFTVTATDLIAAYMFSLL